MRFLKIQAFIIIPILTVWGIYVYSYSKLDLFSDNWPISLLMVFGSFIAGASSEGGGAIAFPGLTLIFNTPPEVARNFSLAIQSIGMSAASIAIIKMKLPVEKRAILYAAIGGFLGILLGAYFIAPFIPAKPAKLFFVSVWLSFGLALWLINRDKTREVQTKIIDFTKSDGYKLIFFGFIGGVITSIFGSGIDILTFCLLTLHFKISEKVATPTSVILMTTNTIAGFLIHILLIRDFQAIAFDYWLVCIPVVVIFAPLGAYFISGRSRRFIAGLLITIIMVQFLGAMIILKPDFYLSLFCLVVFILGSVFFWLLSQTPVTSLLRPRKLKL
jgi:uncharacterized membrane protein YfcA